MSYKSTIVFAPLPGGGEFHLYDTFDPEFADGHTPQRRIAVLLPRSEGLPDGLDYDEPLGSPEDGLAGIDAPLDHMETAIPRRLG